MLGMGLGMDFGLRFGKANRTEVRSCFGCSKPNRYWGIPKTFFFFGRGRAMSTAGVQGRASGAGGEEMEDREEMEVESTSNVPMLAAGGTFIAGTADTTVTEVRHSTKRHRACENVSEDLLNRRIQDYGLFCPERAKNLVWCFFQKYGSKNLKSVEDNLKLSQQALCTICLTDMTRRAHCTVKLGKDNSPSSMMDHLRIHHLVEFDAVAVANSKGLTLAAFKTQQKEPRVRALLGNSSALRWENRFANRLASRETGLEMPCCPANDLLWVQITQSYPNRLRFSRLTGYQRWGMEECSTRLV